MPVSGLLQSPPIGLHPVLLGVQEEHCAKEYCATHNKNKESKKLRIEVVLVFVLLKLKI